MNIDWLKYFVVLAETLNYRQASEKLHITPQALSKAIVGLEEHYQLKLVERHQRVKGLTPEGESLLLKIRPILQDMHLLTQEMAGLKSGEPQGSLRFAGDQMWLNYLLPEFITDLLKDFPGIKPEIYAMLEEDILKHVLTGEIDFGLLKHPPEHPALKIISGIRTPFLIVGRPQPKKHWSQWRYIVPELFQKKLRSPLDGWPEADYPREISLIVASLELAIKFSQAGLGAAYIPELAIREQLKRRTLAVIADPPVLTEECLYIVYRKQNRQTRAIKETIERLEKQSKALSY